MKNNRMLDNKVLVKRIESENTTRSGIILSAPIEEDVNKGLVISVSEGAISQTTGERIPIDIKEGSTVLYAKFAGMKATIEGEDFLILRASDIVMELN